MKKLALVAFALAGCSLTSSTPTTTPANSTDFPARVSTTNLDASAAEFHPVIMRHNAPVATELRICVAPSGEVADTIMLKGSGIQAVDRAVLEAAASWKYETYDGPKHARKCQNIAVVYRLA
jgi:TonB family protein